jgi:hypothetical protein
MTAAWIVEYWQPGPQVSTEVPSEEPPEEPLP